MNQNSSNLQTPLTSDELRTKLEPGQCCVCSKSIKIPLFQQYLRFNYFYLTSKAKTDNWGVNKYIVFICQSCEIEQNKLQEQLGAQSQIFANYLQNNKFRINQLSEVSEANAAELSFSFKRNESQAACGYLSNQIHLCENCNKLEQQFDKYEQSFINYASITKKRALIIAKELALEQFKVDQSQYEQYKISYDMTQDKQEKFYLKMKIEQILDKYKKNNPITINSLKITKN